MKSRYYDLPTIKAIPIVDYLYACGIEPAKRYNGYTLYHAPYREDPNASLKVDFRQNLWTTTAQVRAEASSTLWCG